MTKHSTPPSSGSTSQADHGAAKQQSSDLSSASEAVGGDSQSDKPHSVVLAGRQGRGGKTARRALVAGGVVVALGAAVGLALINPFAPASLSDPPDAGPVELTTREFDDARDVRVSIAVGGDRSSIANTGGTVTRTDCAVGQPVANGSSPVSLNGQPLIALSTTVPPWRDITPGLKGPDVDAIHAALHALDSGVPKQGPATAKTVAAFNALLTKHDGVTARGRVPRTAILWVPPGDAPLIGCGTSVGQTVNPGDPVLQFPPAAVGANIVAMPNKLAEGERVLTIDGEKFAVDVVGTLTDPNALDKLRKLPSFAAALKHSDSEPEVGAILKLAEPVQMTVVPPASVAGRRDNYCVFSDGKPHPVTIIGGQIGQSYVKLADGTTLTHVDPTPPAGGSCTSN